MACLFINLFANVFSMLYPWKILCFVSASVGHGMSVACDPLRMLSHFITEKPAFFVPLWNVYIITY